VSEGDAGIDSGQGSPGTPSQPRDRARLLVFGGAVAFALSPFVTWVKVIPFGDLNPFQLFQAAGDSEAWAWVVVAVGAATAAIAYRNRRPTTLWLAGMIVGLLGGIVSLDTLERLLHAVRDAHRLATVGIGPCITVLGCIAMVARAAKAGAAHASPLRRPEPARFDSALDRRCDGLTVPSHDR
jgi:hypothetical protein